MKKIKTIVTLALMTIVVLIGLWWVGQLADKYHENKESAINAGYNYSKGIIVEKHSYKGKSIKIRYSINHVVYEAVEGWDHNPRNLNVGDSIAFKYAIKQPEIIISELEDNY